MKNIILRAIVALCFTGLMMGANASTVSLVPQTATTNLIPGAVVSFAVDVDFSSDGSTLGGGFDVMFDPTFLSYNGDATLTLGDPAFGRVPDDCSIVACAGGGAGLLESWAFGDFNTVVAGTVGTLSFTVQQVGSSFVSLGPTSGIGGPFVSGVDFVTILNPTYNAIEVTAVPVPAAAWLFGSALGLLGWARRRKA